MYHMIVIYTMINFLNFSEPICFLLKKTSFPYILEPNQPFGSPARRPRALDPKPIGRESIGLKKILQPSTLTVPNDLSFLRAIQAYGREMAQRIGFAKEDIERILLALEEAVVNIIEHAYEEDENATYQIIFEPIGTGLKIIARDKGLPFSPERLSGHHSHTDLMEGSPIGLGSLIMRRSVDEVRFYNLGREGKEVHLVRHLPCKSIVDFQDPTSPRPFRKVQKDTTPSRERKEIQARLTHPSEVVEVSRLFYRGYGYSYVYDAIYYPERLAAMIEEGVVISAVAVTEDQEVVGHGALMRDAKESELAEAGMAVVRPGFRGQGCMNKIFSYLANAAREKGISSLCGQAVTNHVFSQKYSHSEGYRDCALILGLGPSHTSFKGIAETLPQRESVILSFKPLSPPGRVTIYPPLHHKDFVQKVYENLGLERDIVIHPLQRPSKSQEEPWGDAQEDSPHVETQIKDSSGFLMGDSLG